MRRTALTMALVSLALGACRTARDGGGATSEAVQVVTPVSAEPFAGPKVPADRARAALAGKTTHRDPLLRLTLLRMAGASLSEVVAAAAPLLDGGAKKGPTPEAVRVEVALAALADGRKAYAEYLLEPLVDAPAGGVRAGALTALGVIALQDERFDEAARLWKRALAARPGYEAARMNLGFLHLRFGAAVKAREQLLPLKDKWLAAAGLVIAGRMLGAKEEVAAACETVLAARPDHAPSLINCALAALQTDRDFARAEELLEQAAMHAQSVSPEISERAILLRQRVQAERRRGAKMTLSAKTSP